MKIVAQYASAYFVFLYHWKEENQNAILDELEWVRHDAGLTAEQRDSAVDEFIALVAAVDGILQAKAKADGSYFTTTCGRTVHEAEARAIETRISQGLPLAIHPFRRPAPALRQGALQPDQRKAGPAHPAGTRDAAMIQI